jgi:putative phosphoribosyl transferase
MLSNTIFTDRVEAGRELARELEYLRGHDIVVLGLPRGGVPVAAAVADHLKAPLDVIVVRKLGLPTQTELAMGAIGEDGIRVLNEEVIHRSGVSEADIAAVERRERAELEQRARRLRSGHERVSVRGRTAVIVDDGVATGSTARAACEVARAHGAARVVLAVPVAPSGWERRMGSAADDMVCPSTPASFYAVGQWYRDFSPVTDDEVVALLMNQPAVRPTANPGADAEGDVDEEVTIPARGAPLRGHLRIPPEAVGIVVFAHGSGSSRHSPRNQFVARVLNDAGLGTLLFDLLSDREASDRANVFDIELLSGRLVAATQWLGTRPTAHLPIGLFGASTGAAAALWASTEPGIEVAAVVSRGGRPDLAGPRLPDVDAPTRLIVGGSDVAVLRLNEEARNRMAAECEIAIVAGATHLFEEPGTLEQAAALARDWFLEHLHRSGNPPGRQTAKPAPGFDPHLARAREDAEGVAVYEIPDAGAEVITEAEEAQGVEYFEDPDRVLPPLTTKQGAPGHEALVGDEIAREDPERAYPRSGPDDDR